MVFVWIGLIFGERFVMNVGEIFVRIGLVVRERFVRIGFVFRERFVRIGLVVWERFLLEFV